MDTAVLEKINKVFIFLHRIIAMNMKGLWLMKGIRRCSKVTGSL
jgi:hypothetical protein